MKEDKWISLLEKSNYFFQIKLDELILKNEALKSENHQLQEQVKLLETFNKVKEVEIANIKNSISWKLGNGIINVLLFIPKKLNFIKNHR